MFSSRVQFQGLVSGFSFRVQFHGLVQGLVPGFSSRV